MKDSTLLYMSIGTALKGIAAIWVMEIPYLDRSLAPDDKSVKISGTIVDIDKQKNVAYVWVERVCRDKLVVFDNIDYAVGDNITAYARYDGDLIASDIDAANSVNN